MLASSLLAKPPRSSSSIHFVPRQVMLQKSGAVMDKVEGKESAKEKKERKKRSSETNQLDKRIVCGVQREGLGQDVLLRSIAAFLDNNGLSKTLCHAFRSPARDGLLGIIFCKLGRPIWQVFGSKDGADNGYGAKAQEVLREGTSGMKKPRKNVDHTE